MTTIEKLRQELGWTDENLSLEKIPKYIDCLETACLSLSAENERLREIIQNMEHQGAAVPVTMADVLETSKEGKG